MSEYTPSNPNDDDKTADELLGRLELFRFDPVLESLFEDIAIAQEQLPGYNERETRDQLRRLNDMLRLTGWLGTPVEVTGKLRLAPWCDIDEAYDDHVKAQAHEDHDAQGVYYEVAGLPMVCALIDVVDDNESSTGRIVMTLTTPDAMIDAEDGVGDVDMDELLGSAGEYYFYLSDIVELSFRQPSTAQIGVMLQDHFPEIMKQILHDIPSGEPAGHHLRGSLKRFELPVHARYTRELRRHIAEFIYDHICPDSQTDYQFTLDGKIATMSVERGMIWAEMPPQTSLRGKIVDFDFVEKDGVYRMAFVVAEESTMYDGGFELRLIPVDSVEKLRCLRPSRKKFADLAIMGFLSPEEIREYWREVQGDPRPLPPLEASTEPGADDDDMFAALTADLSAELDGMSRHEPLLDAELISVDGDVRKIAEDFQDHMRMSEDWDLDVPLNDAGLAEISRLMGHTLSRLDDMRLDDMLVVDGTMLVLDERGQGVSDVIMIDGGARLVGTIAGTVICDVPEMALYDEGTGETALSSIGVGVLLADCRIIDDGEIHDAPFYAPQVIVVISPDQDSKFYKAVAKSDN